ncbi:MAG: RluA family pseudouridine synthase [Actinomycetota bacterium]|nr:RluA family pseudouridine synthase [Actinomycetota bacterium]MEC9425305.1 RluA family pseudouridine synthase [Actinomycetota bacterium]MED5221603.1 RluA family pseudouridine synthase [Actinomycetota bacterium]MED5232625.1 RluA family pseudouridine synthase [Actinomycetota bacterium]MEE2958493.1 RluA family pseudouridine synthase [Actinomycetota bacterium]
MKDRADQREPTLRESVPAVLVGERIDRVVALLADVSRSRAGDSIDRGLVSLNGVVVGLRSRRVAGGEELVVVDLGREATHVPEPDPSVAIDFLHEDDQVLVVDKPAGLVVHPGAGNLEGTLVNGLLARYPDLAGVGSAARPGIVHRLDQGTSGALVVARTEESYASLVDQLAERTVGRRYRALVWGQPESAIGVVDAPIGRSGRDRTRMAVISSGRPARTRYEQLQAWEGPPEVSLLECRLETGRTHQIRVHLSAIGHPLIGDAVYGGDRSGRPGGGQVASLERPFLHAAHLAFDHPTGGGRISIESPLPADLAEVLDRLGAPAVPD